MLLFELATTNRRGVTMHSEKDSIKLPEIIKRNGSFVFPDSVGKGEYKVRRIGDFGALLYIDAFFRGNRLLNIEYGGFSALHCFLSARGIMLQEGNKIRLQASRIYSGGLSADEASVILSSSHRTRWFILTCHAEEYVRHIKKRYPGIDPDPVRLFDSVKGRRFYPELETIIMQALQYNGGIASDLYYESKYNEIMAWLMKYQSSQDGSPAFHVSAADRSAIMKVADMISQKPSSDLNLSGLSSLAHMSVSKFKTVFKAVMGCSANDYRNEMRLNHARELLSSSDMTLSEVSAAVGYKKAENFNRFFSKNMGISPKDFRLSHVKSAE